jgi:hypothetical protein
MHHTMARRVTSGKKSPIVRPKLFRRSVVASRDLLFTQVLESVDSFLPELSRLLAVTWSAAPQAAPCTHSPAKATNWFRVQE